LITFEVTQTPHYEAFKLAWSASIWQQWQWRSSGTIWPRNGFCSWFPARCVA